MDDARGRTRRELLASGAVALAPALAGCSGGDDGEPSDPAPGEDGDRGGAGTDTGESGTGTNASDSSTDPSTDGEPAGSAGPTDAWRHGHDVAASVPLVTEDALYYVRSGEEIHYVARDLDSGEQRWERATGPAYSSGLSMGGGTLYAVDDERLLALDPADGALRWEPPSVPTSRLGTWYAATDDAAFVCTPETVVGIDAQSADRRWESDFPGDGSMIAEITPGPGRLVHVTSVDGTLATYDRDSGEVLWTYDYEPWCCGPIITLSAVDGTLYLGHDDPGGDNYLLAFDPGTGEQHWTNEGTYPRGRPHRLEGRLYVPLRDTSSTILALDPGTGEADPTWSTDGAPSKQLHLNVADGAFYHLIGRNHGSIAAIDAADGSIRWEYETGGADTLSMGGEHLLYTSGNEFVALTRP